VERKGVPIKTTQQSTMECAAELLGGVLALADSLQVPLSTVSDWIAGREKVPNSYFLRTVDIVLALSQWESS
jgi:hypothetical protein